MNENPAAGRSWWAVVGATLAGLAVVTGAFGAHGLPEYLQTLYEGEVREVFGESIPSWKKYLGDFQTAAEYQMYHGLGLVALGLLSGVRCRKSVVLAGWSLLLGTFLFSGSLYVLVLTKQTWLGMITPIGGILFIVGWVAFAFAVCPCSSGSCPTDFSDSMESTT